MHVHWKNINARTYAYVRVRSAVSVGERGLRNYADFTERGQSVSLGISSGY